MADFAPKLSGGVAYNQPVQTPNAMSAVADLFNFGISTLKSGGDAPKMTEDEKFAVAVKEFESEKGATFQWDRKGMREFIFKYPQFNSQAKAYGENLGVMTTSPQEASRDSVLEWAKTPEGTMAAAVASGMEEEEGTAYLSEQFTKQKQQEAEIAKINRNVEQLTAEGTLQGKQWDAIKPTQKSMVDTTVQAVIGPIVSEVMNGVTVEVPPELQAMLGVRYDKVDMANLPALLQDAKIALGNNARGAFSTSFGTDALPSEQWNKDVFSSLDALIEIGKAIDSPQERAAAMQSLIDSKTIETLDGAGVAVAINIFKTLPPDVANTLLGQVPELSGKLASVLAPSTGGELFPTKIIAENAAKLSTDEANKLASDAIKIIEKQITPEFFTVFKEASKRSGYNVVDAASYKAIVGENLNEIKRLTAENPEFRAGFSDWLVKDIQQTISTVRSNLPSEVSLVVNSKGQFSFVYTGTGTTSRAEAAMGSSAFAAAEIKKAEEALPEDLNLRVLNEKIATLGLMGEFGKEIQDAVGILNTEPKGKTSPSRGGRPPKGRGRGRNVGAELGIDFEGYEAEAGLPTGFLNTMAIIESGGNPSAQNDSSSAGGLFQQIDSNAAQYGVVNRLDPVQSTEGAVAFAQDNSVYLSSRLGREPTGGELYLAHQQGPAGAVSLLSQPDKLAVDIVGAKAVKLNGGSSDMTAQEFANIWINRYNKIATGGIGPAGAPVSVAKSGGASESVPNLPLGSESIDSAVMQGGTRNSPVEALGGTVEGLSAPEVQQIVEMAATAPEEAIKLAKEMLNKPINPMIKALIEALVMIGGK